MQPSILTHLIRTHVGRILTGGVLASAMVACASSRATTPALVDARNAYDQAEDSPAADHNPAGLERARLALARAEDAHDDDPGSAREAHLARRAEARARAAMTNSRSTDAARAEWREHVAEERAEARAEERAEVRADTAEARAQRAELRADTTEQARIERARIERANDPNAPARPMTKQEQRNAAAALQNLGPVANVKEEPRGVVITLSGSLLFPNGKEEMTPIARQNLDQVAHALAKQPHDATFQVEGHTDNSGSDTQNTQLATERARAVADHLVKAGIDPARIKVVGHGETHPVASNDTPEGRASNRRVEIVVAGQS